MLHVPAASPLFHPDLQRLAHPLPALPCAQISSKANALSIDSCSKTGVVFGDLISACEVGVGGLMEGNGWDGLGVVLNSKEGAHASSSADAAVKLGSFCSSFFAPLQVVNSKQLQLQATGSVATVTIEKTDGVQLYLPHKVRVCVCGHAGGRCRQHMFYTGGAAVLPMNPPTARA